MKKFILAHLLVSSLLLTGCVSTKTVELSQENANQLTTKTIASTQRERPDFAAVTPGKALFAVVGAALMIQKGNAVVRENNVEDPANYIGEQLLAAMAEHYQMEILVDHAETTTSDSASDIATQFKDVDYVLDVQTVNWSYGYFLGLNKYRVIYSAKLRLIDTNRGQLVAEGFCSRTPDQTANSPTLDELLADNAQRLKDELIISADHCIDEFKINVLKL